MEIILDLKIETGSLDSLQRNLQEKIPHILEQIGIYMVASVDENFAQQGRPHKWLDLKPATWKRKTGKTILEETGQLRSGIDWYVSGETVSIGPSGPAEIYAAIHQFGGQAGANLKAHIPARPYLVIQEEDRRYIEDFVKNEITDG